VPLEVSKAVQDSLLKASLARRGEGRDPPGSDPESRAGGLRYLQEHGFEKVEVFSADASPRNNLGRWPVRVIPPAHARKDFEYYATKDRAMAAEATVGLMLWDGQSRGTLMNVLRLAARDKPDSRLRRQPEARREVNLLERGGAGGDAFLVSRPESRARLERVSALIEGFETPHGMELLSSVHWVAKRDRAVRQADDAVRSVRSWNERKRRTFPASHVAVAWEQLASLGWLRDSTAAGEVSEAKTLTT
jgi:hypothetical protein